MYLYLINYVWESLGNACLQNYCTTGNHGMEGGKFACTNMSLYAI
jgi:hypothetical protein